MMRDLRAHCEGIEGQDDGLEPMLLLFLMLATSCLVSWPQTGEVRHASTVTNSLSTIIST